MRMTKGGPRQTREEELAEARRDLIYFQHQKEGLESAAKRIQDDLTLCHSTIKKYEKRIEKMKEGA